MLGGYSSKDYRAFRLWAESLDGAQVQLGRCAGISAWLIAHATSCDPKEPESCSLHSHHTSFHHMSLPDYILMESCQV